MTSDDAFHVDMAEVVKFVADLRTFLASAHDRVDKLNSTVDRLHITWQGDAADAHREAHARWINGMAEMKDGIEDIARAANHSHDAFAGVQELHRKMWP